ncbi:MAG: hypothetical protein CML16_14395 [Pusillimonas sp.]|nr:hypothetical protein [Pusillimonas sp.]MBC43420.1 hypothetical protein [Pusillimonas sp.]HCP76842.1 hypothetical protein [Pusillimonas sp.]|tara:strand:+ start:4229 stop:4711 length:483 start_codon:yes stop_codon:yes gene_type:complete
MSSTIARASGVIKVALALLLMAAVLLNCANIFSRYFFNETYLGSDELQVFAMILIAFLGTICISNEQQHLRMDVLSHYLRPTQKRYLSILETLITIIVSGTVAWASFGFVKRLYSMNQHSGMADIPMWIPHGTITLAFVAITLIAFLRLVDLSRGQGGSS